MGVRCACSLALVFWIMQKKSSATSTRNYPRIPPEHGDVQVNHCKSPRCINYGVPAEQTSARGSNRYTLDSHKGISSCICTSCGEGFPLKSNLGIAEEVERSAVTPSSVINILTQRLGKTARPGLHGGCRATGIPTVEVSSHISLRQEVR